jgi:hypothetical protein
MELWVGGIFLVPKQPINASDEGRVYFGKSRDVLSIVGIDRYFGMIEVQRGCYGYAVFGYTIA